jgi:flagellar hook-length control protein FliK
MTSLLQLLGRQSESALARVQMNQLTTLHSQQQGEERILNLELPIFNGRECEVVQLKVQRETRQSGGEAESCWSVTLKLDNEGYGAIRAVVSLVGGKVSTSFWCEQPQTQRHFQQHLEELRQRMQQQGLELGRTQAFSGQPPEPDAAATPHANDNLINTRA